MYVVVFHFFSRSQDTEEDGGAGSAERTSKIPSEITKVYAMLGEGWTQKDSELLATALNEDYDWHGSENKLVIVLGQALKLRKTPDSLDIHTACEWYLIAHATAIWEYLARRGQGIPWVDGRDRPGLASPEHHEIMLGLHKGTLYGKPQDKMIREVVEAYLNLVMKESWVVDKVPTVDTLKRGDSGFPYLISMYPKKTNMVPVLYFPSSLSDTYMRGKRATSDVKFSIEAFLEREPDWVSLRGKFLSHWGRVASESPRHVCVLPWWELIHKINSATNMFLFWIVGLYDHYPDRNPNDSFRVVVVGPPIEFLRLKLGFPAGSFSLDELIHSLRYKGQNIFKNIGGDAWLFHDPDYHHMWEATKQRGGPNARRKFKLSQPLDDFYFPLEWKGLESLPAYLTALEGFFLPSNDPDWLLSASPLDPSAHSSQFLGSRVFAQLLTDRFNFWPFSKSHHPPITRGSPELLDWIFKELKGSLESEGGPKAVDVGGKTIVV